MQYITRYTFSIIVLCALSLTSGGVLAHGAHGNDHPLHGGVVKVIGDMSFELVNGDNRIELYLLDDGKMIQSKGMQAILQITTNGVKSELTLTPSGDNRFSIDGKTIAAGAKVLALVTLEDGSSKVGARFTIE